MNRAERIQKLDKLKKTKKPYKEDDIIYRSEKKLMPVYEIPLELLIYNKYNGRILSMTKSYERQFRTINPEDDEDKALIEKFLWESKENRNKVTLSDLRVWGQKRVGIVTRDGIVIDGNRRASLLNRIAREDSKDPMYFKAIILDDTLDDNPKEIMRLETSYQMGEDEKLDYNPIEKYLKCKDLVSVGFKPADIAQMMSEKESRIKEWLSIMKLMDSYLEDLGYSGIYTRLDKREGQFVDLNKYLNKYNGRTSLADWSYKETDIADLKAIAFDYIRAEYEGKEFRAIALPSKKESFFCKKDVWETFRDEHFDQIDPINDAEPTVEELKDKNPGSDLSAVLKVRDMNWKEKSLPQLKRNLDSSQRDLDDVNEANQPLELLRRTLNTLKKVKTSIPAFYEDEHVAKMISDIKKKVNELEEIIQKLSS